LKAGCDGVIGRIGRNLGLAMLAAASLGHAAQAQDMVGAPHAWGFGLQAAGGPIKERIHDFNDLLLWIIVLITIFVAALLAWCIWKYDHKKNPIPSQNSHNTVLEIAWTVIPVLILLVIAIPSFRLIYYEDRARDADLTINVTGRQWYWNYAFPDNGNFNFDSRIVADADLKEGQLRNLTVDEPLVIPVNTTVRVMTHGQDVIHSFFVPSLGVQRYAIPGRTIETWMRADHTGTFYGQCNQICGTNHAFMPIVVRAVPQAEFDAWVASARTRFADSTGAQPAPAPIAAAAPATEVQLAARQ